MRKESYVYTCDSCSKVSPAMESSYTMPPKWSLITLPGAIQHLCAGCTEVVQDVINSGCQSTAAHALSEDYFQ